MATKTRITFMRHGRSRADDEKVHEGRYDSPLTDVGRAQVRSRGQSWTDSATVFDAIISSTLKRASESAEILAEVLGVSVEYDQDWMERDNGQLAGRPIEKIQKTPLFIEAAGPFSPYDIVSGTGESKWDLVGRSARALQNIVRRGEGSFLVVAHGGVINAAMSCICGNFPGPTTDRIGFRLTDTGFVDVLYEPEKNLWTITGMSS